jgi:hypothetical protein
MRTMIGQYGSGLHPNFFSVKSVYNHMTTMDNDKAYKTIWKAKILEKVKIFMWLVMQKSILTKDNMIKRNWGGDPDAISVMSPKRWITFYFHVL